MPKPSKKEISQAADDMLELILTSPNAGFLKEVAFEYLEHKKGKVGATAARVLYATGAFKPMFSGYIAKKIKSDFFDHDTTDSFSKVGSDSKEMCESTVLAFAIKDLMHSRILDTENTKHIEAWLIKNPAMQSACKKALLVSGNLTEAQLKTPKALSKELCNARYSLDIKDYLHFGSALLGRPLPHAAEWEKAIIHLRKDDAKKSTGFVAPEHTTPEILPPPMTPLLPKGAGLAQRC